MTRNTLVLLLTALVLAAVSLVGCTSAPTPVATVLGPDGGTGSRVLVSVEGGGVSTALSPYSGEDTLRSGERVRLVPNEGESGVTVGFSVDSVGSDDTAALAAQAERKAARDLGSMPYAVRLSDDPATGQVR